MVDNLFIQTILWIFLVGGITFFFRKKIASIFKVIPLPRFILYLIVGVLFSILEENINCPPTGCELVPPTIPIFAAFLVIHLIIISVLKLFKVRSFYLAISIFGLMGWAAEFLLGSHQGILWSSPAVTIIMSVWTFVTYAIIVIVPSTIFLEKKPEEE